MRELRRKLVLSGKVLWLAAIIAVLLPAITITAATTRDPPLATRQEPITPVPQPPLADPLKLALGERLFADKRLSRDGSRACTSCHDIRANGADHNRKDTDLYGSQLRLRTLTVFNAALSFRLNWEGNYRTLEAHAESSLESQSLGSSVEEAVKQVKGQPALEHRFEEAYGHGPDGDSMLDAFATFERSLVTPGSRFDRWLEGDVNALSAKEQEGYQLFKSLGCVSCHQGVNIGGNLFERHGIFHPLGSPQPEILRVPSLRNVATMAPYFHDGSAATLDEAVRQMAYAQLDDELTDQQVNAIVAFLQTLTGTYRGAPITAVPP
jgi:cytochrome c peroxidase